MRTKSVSSKMSWITPPVKSRRWKMLLKWINNRKILKINKQTRKLWDNFKRNNMRIFVEPESQEKKSLWKSKVRNQSLKDKAPELKSTCAYILNAHRATAKRNLMHTLIRKMKTILEIEDWNQQEQKKIIYEESLLRCLTHLSQATLQVWRQWW